MSKIARYDLIADLFVYPNEQFPKKVTAVIDYLKTDYPEAALEIEKFSALLPADDITAMQELFTRSFDVQAATTLDIGYILFGDDYKRGEMLSYLNVEHRKVGVDCGAELSDHLPNLLKLINRLEDKELLNDLVVDVIAPALKMMLKEFTQDRIKEKNKSYEKHYRTLIEMPRILSPDKTIATTLYQFVIKGLRSVLAQDFVIKEREALRYSADFLKSVTGENEIEAKAAKAY